MKSKFISSISLIFVILTFATALMSVSASPEDVRDVAIVGVEVSQTTAIPGEIVSINVTAINLGNVTESFDVEVYANETEIDTLPVTNLEPGNETTLTFEWNTTELEPCHFYKITANATGVPDDLNMTNNFFEDGLVKILYKTDLNGDCEVDMWDIALAAQAFGAFPGHSRWNPVADLNDDNMVDLKDLGTIAKDFGKT